MDSLDEDHNIKTGSIDLEDPDDIIQPNCKINGATNQRINGTRISDSESD